MGLVFCSEREEEAEVWSAPVKKKQRHKNPHAVALGRLGSLVRSEAKKRANKQNGRKGGLVKSRKKTIAARRNARRPRPGRRPQERMSAAVASIRARFGPRAIGLGYLGIRYVRVRLKSTL
jgi:hypothetical protein